MRDIIKKVPIPTAGVALGLAALGNLLQPYAEVAHIACGALSLFLVAMLVAKLIMFPSMLREDMKNSVFASVSATFFMTLMQLAGYLAPVAIVPAFGLWCSAVAGHFVLMTWFTLYYIRRFKLTEVFPTYFICYVGIIVAAVTSPVFGAEAFGQGIFWFGFACYLVLLAVVTMRYIKHEIPEGARPLFCIYAAPMGLSLVGYLSVMPDPNLVFVAVLMGLGQLMLIGVVTRVPKFLALQFYPSYAAMTFPFVISAMALGKGVQALYACGYSIPGAPGDRGPHRRGDAVRRRDGRLRLRALHEVLLRYAEGGQGPEDASRGSCGSHCRGHRITLEHLSPRRPDVLLWPTTGPSSPQRPDPPLGRSPFWEGVRLVAGISPISIAAPSASPAISRLPR